MNCWEIIKPEAPGIRDIGGMGDHRGSRIQITDLRNGLIEIKVRLGSTSVTCELNPDASVAVAAMLLDAAGYVSRRED